MSENKNKNITSGQSEENNKFLGIRKEMRDLYDHPLKRDYMYFKRVVNENLDYLMQNKEFDSGAVRNGSKGTFKNLRQREVALLIDSSSTTVNHWLNWKKNRKSLPDACSLYNLARGFGVDIDFLLTDHKDVTVEKDYTYWSVFRTIDDLNKLIGLEANNKDVFLDYLLSESAKLRSMKSLSPEIKTQWLMKIKKDFDRPLIQDVMFTRFGYCSLTFTDSNPFKEIQYPQYERMVEVFNVLTDYWESKDDNWSPEDFFEYCKNNEIDCDSGSNKLEE